MEKENANRSLKLLTNNVSNGVLLLQGKALNLLKQKHPKSCELSEEIILSGEKPLVHPVILKI